MVVPAVLVHSSGKPGSVLVVGVADRQLSGLNVTLKLPIVCGVKVKTDVLITLSMANWAAAMASSCICILPAIRRLVLLERMPETTSKVNTISMISDVIRVAPR